MKSIRDRVGSTIPLRSLHASFIAPITHQGPAVSSSEILRAGRSVTQARGTLVQDGQNCFEMVAIFGQSQDSEMSFGSDSPLLIEPEAATRLPYLPDVTPNCTQHYDILWVKGEPPFSQARDARATILARPAVAELAYTEADFLVISDVIPPWQTARMYSEDGVLLAISHQSVAVFS